MFTIRVYGLLINDQGELLLSDELRKEMAFTKFPGGGIDLGEGHHEALKREFQEEVGIEVEVGDFFYFNDFCQFSAFDAEQQVIAFYYFVKYPNWQLIPVNQTGIPRHELAETHRWVALSALDEHSVTFAVDKIVIRKLIDDAV
jgi:8-oxo-dGTP diphosphatase